MGIHIPWPVPPNFPCVCWDEGMPFHPWPQTLYVQATVTGIIKGPLWRPPLPEPPNGLYELTETESCFYSSIGPFISVYWFLQFGIMQFKLDLGPNPNIFLDEKLGCHYSFENTNPHQPAFWINGSARVTWLGGP